MDAKNGIHLFNCIRACIAYCLLAVSASASAGYYYTNYPSGSGQLSTLSAIVTWLNNWYVNSNLTSAGFSCTAVSGPLDTDSTHPYVCSAVNVNGVKFNANATYVGTWPPDDFCAKVSGQTAVQAYGNDGQTGAYTVNDSVYIKGLKVDPSLSLDSNSLGKTCTPNNNSDNAGTIGRCEIIYSFDMSAKAADGTYTLWGSSAKYTGQLCSSSEKSVMPSSQGTTQVQPFLPPVPKGKCPGTVNGVDVIVDCITTTSSSTSSTSTTATSASGAVSSSGSSTNTTVTCTGANSCTTITTVTNSDGSKTSTSKTGTAQGTCKEQPGSAACALAGTGFSGSCSSGFKATSDDAVINAMAEEQYRRNCQLYTSDTDQSSLYNQAANGTDSKNADSLKKNGSTVNIPSSLDMSGFGWGRSCPADPMFTFPYGIVVTLPFSKICFLLQIMGYFGVALTLLVSVIWVSGLREGNS